MFGKRTGEPQQPKKVDTIIGKDTRISGRIQAEGTIRIEGTVDGEIDADGDVIVGEPGRLVASIHARNVTVAGEVQGNIHSEGRLELLPTGKLYGDVKTAVLAIEDGAIFKGACEMTEAPARGRLLPGKTAPPALPEGEDGASGDGPA
ncbi:MAG: polymer-forming cytoskeletal protein [Firmicutes bacterium]|jgi:cytoskeletal protein CcmA (bactofilin family)|nr:polymer-forming cytoskeletal protein [Bacillota bacterium]MDH7495850.1 polymer-forming cytoskeletal protein [Bacillota bacterium]